MIDDGLYNLWYVRRRMWEILEFFQIFGNIPPFGYKRVRDGTLWLMKIVGDILWQNSVGDDNVMDISDMFDEQSKRVAGDGILHCHCL